MSQALTIAVIYRRIEVKYRPTRHQQGRAFDDKWYISFPVVQTLLRAYGLSANQKNVAAVFEE